MEDMLRYAEPDTIKNYFENIENGDTIKVNISDDKQLSAIYLRNDDAVLTKRNGDFVTVMKGSVKSNAGVKNARKQ